VRRRLAADSPTCRQALASDPDNVAARYGVAMALAAEGHYEDALRHLLVIVKTKSGISR